MHTLIEKNKEKLSEICKKHFIKSLYVFGSITKNNFKETSDIDFLYEIDTDRFKDWATGSYDYTDNILSFESELNKLFNRPVDLVPNIYIQNRFLKKSIEESKRLVYAA